MQHWTEASRRVSEFVDKFLDRALGATNDPRQRVQVYDPLPNKVDLGKLLPKKVSEEGNEYKAKVAPCSYIAAFLVKGRLTSIKLRITPSFNLYFLTAINKAAGSERDAEPDRLELYSAEADPLLPAISGRDDMWVNWRERMREVSKAFTTALLRLVAPKDSKGKLQGLYNPNIATSAYIRKRYCTHLDVELSSTSSSEAVKKLDLGEFRAAYVKLGRSPEWEGEVKAIAVSEGENTRITVYLTNTFSKKSSPSGDPNWYDTHLKVELLGEVEIFSVPCPVLDQTGQQVPKVAAEAKNCAFDELNSAGNILTFAPIARTRTTRRIAREVTFSFRDSAGQPRQLLQAFYSHLEAQGAPPAELEGYRQEIDLLLSDDYAIKAIGMVARVYSKAIAESGQWRLHQLATLIRSAAMYLRREKNGQTQPSPLVLNVPTAGGKTEAFFATAMFCAFYELLRRRRSVNIIKYPMTLLSSDQVARLSKYSMIIDEIACEVAGAPLGIGYMVGKKGQFDEPDQIIEQCPYPDVNNESKMCGERWVSSTVERGMPTLTCAKGHMLHLGIDKREMLTRQCPAFIVAIWDKFVSQAGQRRLGLFLGADGYRCPRHGNLDYADTNQSYYQDKPLPPRIECQVYEGGGRCGEVAHRVPPVIPGVIVYDEGHLIRESTGTLDAHFETAYLQIAQDLSGKQPICIVSTATIAGIADFLEQLGLIGQPNPSDFYTIPPAEEQDVYFQTLPGEMQHEALALCPFDVMLTWAVPDLIDVFFETLASDYGYDALNPAASPPPSINHLRQVMAYCSSYKNISALAEMNRNAIATNRQHRGREMLKTLQLSSRYFSRVKAQKAISDVKKIQQQIIYATNIASIGIDIENLDVIFFFGLPTNVSEFIQAMNRTGRREGKPAICVAILGPNKERDMSYYRYWPQFVKGANQILEPVPLNRFASSAIDRTFYNVATALLLMDYAQRSKYKLFSACNVRVALQKKVVSSKDLIDKLKHIYRAEADPAQEYGNSVERLWSSYTAKLAGTSYDTFLSNIFEANWMFGLRSVKRPVTVLYPEVSEMIERSGAGQLVTGDTDSEAVADVADANVREREEA